MRVAARHEFEAHYAAQASHDRLMRIYAAARERMEQRLKEGSSASPSAVSASARAVDG
jgi:hypothetical protein